jgi:hypothetical protein
MNDPIGPSQFGQGLALMSFPELTDDAPEQFRRQVESLHASLCFLLDREGAGLFLHFSPFPIFLFTPGPATRLAVL